MKKEKKYTDEQNEKDLTNEVRLVISEINAKRSKITATGKELKRSPFGTLKERGLMTADFLMQEFERIQNKQSSLPSGERKVISEIVMAAFGRLMTKRAIIEESNKKEEEK